MFTSTTIKIYHFITDFIDCVITIIKIAKNSKIARNLTKNNKLNKKDCVILGNGPSLNETIKQNAGYLKKVDLFCVSNFALTEHFIELKPENYILADPAYWTNNASTRIKNINQRILKIFERKVSWNLNLYLPFSAEGKNILNGKIQNPYIKIYYYNSTSVKCNSSLRFFLYRHYLAMPMAINVIIASIYIGLNLGYKNIYLVGADHTWHENLYVNDHNTLFIQDKHFYGDEKMKFYTDQTEVKVFKMHELFYALAKTFKAYYDLEEYSRNIGARIFNSSQRSFIDAFERKKLNIKDLI
jgi:hypothetical protein